MKPRILFVAPHTPDRAPSQRFRFEQFLGYLTEQGFEYDFSYLVSARDSNMFYSRGNTLKKSFFLLRKMSKRFGDILRAGKYDIIYIQREAFFFGPAIFEFLFSKSKARLVFDFDDSIWIPNVSEVNKRFEWLKNYGKTAKIISYADVVLAGNRYLADFALKNNPNVCIIPTTIDTTEYQRKNADKPDRRIVIGWSGSITTIQHFKLALPFLRKIHERYSDKISFKVIGDKDFSDESIGVKGQAWSKENEIDELSDFDIGIMPLPDDQWAKGKCGLKGLQYMALEIPTIMSPVGVNSAIIQDGVNGFLASTENEWIEKLSLLIGNSDLRRRLGQAGRKTVVEKYSFDAWKDQYLKLFTELLK